MKPKLFEAELLGIELINEILKVRVRSTGDLRPEDFHLEIFEAGKTGEPYRIVIYRTVEEKSQVILSEGLLLEFKYEDLVTEHGRYPKSGDRIIVENLFSVQ